MRLYDAIDGLIDTYNSIDVRIVAGLVDNVWHSIITIIRFRHEDATELKEIHQRFIDKCGLMKTDNFRVGLYQFPINDWSKIRSNLEQKFLCLSDDFAINFDTTIDLNYSTEPSSHVNDDYVNTEWLAYQRRFDVSSSPVHGFVSTVSHLAIKHTFNRMEDYLAAILQIHRNHTSQTSVSITIPIFFEVLDTKFDTDSFEINYKGYPQKNIKIGINFYKSEGWGNSFELIDKTTITTELSGNPKEISQQGHRHSLDTKSVGNEFETIVTKNDSVILYHDKLQIKDHWATRTNITNPVFSVFQKFVPLEELEKMLFEFQGRGKTNDSSLVFERAVNWLLNLLGLNAILLGKTYEKTGKGSEEISFDIIGSFSNNLVLLVNATIGFPKQSDFDRERDYRNKLSKSLQNPDVVIKSVYFTGQDTTESRDSAKSNNVVFIDKPKLKLIFEMLKKGDLDKARNVIIEESDFGAPL